MKRRRLILILFDCVTAAVLTTIFWPREHEPEYNGVPLTTWLQRFNNDERQSREAIQKIGTNALPYLVRWIQYEAPGWRTFLNAVHRKLPASIQNASLSRLLFRDGAEIRAELAVEAFWALRSEGVPATDRLLQFALSDSPHALATQRRARYCLMNMTSCLPPEHVHDLAKP